MGRFSRWLFSPGFTGFTRVAHAFWVVGGLLGLLGSPAAIVWFGVCCWRRDTSWIVVAGFASVACVQMANMTLIVASKMLTTESIDAKLRGRDDLDF